MTFMDEATDPGEIEYFTVMELGKHYDPNGLQHLRWMDPVEIREEDEQLEQDGYSYDWELDGDDVPFKSIEALETFLRRRVIFYNLFFAQAARPLTLQEQAARKAIEYNLSLESLPALVKSAVEEGSFLCRDNIEGFFFEYWGFF